MSVWCCRWLAWASPWLWSCSASVLCAVNWSWKVTVRSSQPRSTSPRRSSARPRSWWGPARRMWNWLSVRAPVYPPQCRQPWKGRRLRNRKIVPVDITCLSAGLASWRTASVAGRWDTTRGSSPSTAATTRTAWGWREVWPRCRWSAGQIVTPWLTPWLYSGDHQGAVCLRMSQVWLPPTSSVGDLEPCHWLTVITMFKSQN